MRILAALLAAAAVLLVVELSMGALDFGETHAANPCTSRSTYPGGGIDATVQRVVLDGLNGAACSLHTTREQLVLSFRPSPSRKRIRWDPQTIERAVRAGMLRAIDRAQARGDLPGAAAFLLREIANHAPVATLVKGGSEITDLLDRILP